VLQVWKMQPFKLPLLQGNKPTIADIVFFSCDEIYYEKYGKPLIKSILKQIPWIGVHCHVIQKDENFQKLNHTRLTHTYEVVDDQFINSIPIASGKDFSSKKYDFEPTPLITYYACCRFMRAGEIFNENSVLQIDCDSLLFHPFSQHSFRQLTEVPRAMRKPKSIESVIASAISFGTGKSGMDFRSKMSAKMFKAFSAGSYWFIDQAILEQIFNEDMTKIIPQHWNTWSFKSKKEAYFRTGKGNKKDTNELYIEHLDKWTREIL